MKFICPYCKTGITKKKIAFSSWKAVNRHISYCPESTESLFCDEVYGPISIDFINKHSTSYLKTIYPKFKTSFAKVRSTILPSPLEWRKDELVLKAKEFYIEHLRIPTSKDYMEINFYPSKACVYNHFTSWEQYILAAELEYTNKGYGYPTTGIDGNRYRSTLEAIFADKFLFNKYDYIIEPRYPHNINKYYDWYIPYLDLYIELAGGLRNNIIQEKIELNKLFNNKLLVIKPSYIYKYTNLQDILNAKI